MDRTFLQYIFLYLKGVAMGAADVVPGVSGGTIAFISGIYQELLDSIRSFDLKALKLFRSGEIRALWRYVNGNFLLVLFSGVITSLITLAQIIHYLLNHHGILVWSFFFGLIIASIIYIFRQLGSITRVEILTFLIGTGVALIVSVIKPAQLPAEWWMIFIAGFIAICAMILPGVSGSFLLLLMGMYTVFIEALKDVNLALLSWFVAGCICGLLVFSRALAWLLRQYRDPTLALLTGFLLGSLNVIWPWKQVVDVYVSSSGKEIPLEQVNLLPMTFESVVGVDSQLTAAIGLIVFGMVLVLFLEWLAVRFRQTDAPL